MKKLDGSIILSAHDLVGHTNCQHLTNMDLMVANGELAKPAKWDPLLEILRERGIRHEQAYIKNLQDEGLTITVIPGVDVDDKSVDLTLDAMKAGHPIIIQAALKSGDWIGRADVLRRIEVPSQLSEWSYEIIDTKLARETKGGTVLQLSLYAELLRSMQGIAPEFIYVVAPWSNFEPQEFRVADYAAFFRKAQKATEAAVADDESKSVYPEPKEHCDVCRWSDVCEKRRRDDDHLCLVANISKTQITELQARGIGTAKALGETTIPLPWTPEKGSSASFEKSIAQAKIQVDAREQDKLLYEIIEQMPDSGLALLPEPSPGDVFFDLEGDSFIVEGGLEYLFGYHYRDDNGEIVRVADWAFNREEEKTAFENFMNFVTARREQFPGMHIYHYAPYEPSTLKRLMGRYATKETEVDNLLRGKVLVDLFTVVRNSIRASVESYSIKKLEPFYEYERKIPLKDANVALAALQVGLEFNDIPSIEEDTKDKVAGYNDDDCLSTEALRDWLESLRAEAMANGVQIERPEPGQEGPSEEISEHEERIAALIERLTSDVPVDVEERNLEQQGRWILANILDWHRREDKATWWEYFRLSDLQPIELLTEKSGLGELKFIETVDRSARGIPTDRYSFSHQDTDLRGGETLKASGGDSFGSAVSISQENWTIDVKKTGATAELHPDGIFAHEVFRTSEQVASLLRLGDYVAEHGIEGLGSFQSARDLLLRHAARLGETLLHVDGETTLENALRIIPEIQGGVIPIQGPPGTGKSFTGAHMICELVKQGKKVGVTANSHKVIRNLIDKAVEIAEEQGLAVNFGQKLSSKEDDTDFVKIFTDNGKANSAISSGQISVLGGTSFYWARAEIAESVDVLIVDEAAQMSLANVLAVSHSAPSLILLGDPQQLDQPTKGTHPEGTGVSALDHILNGKKTISESQGLFLSQTWRLHPNVCSFNSELFYENKLESHADCENQNISSVSEFNGTGLIYVPVSHYGDNSNSAEEADAIRQIVETILSSDTTWTDRDGNTRLVTKNDIIIIAPYNAQVYEIQERLPAMHVGTVDKFQGQEAAIAIYSMATSSHADAPRGMDFLYSSNRLNVAISRAKCLAILVSSPQLFEADCKTPRQMQLVNAFCRYLEMAEVVNISATGIAT